MAEKSKSGESNAELRQRIAVSRVDFTRDVGGLEYELNFPLKFKKSFQRNTDFWVGSALALGLLIALLRARTQKVYLNSAAKKVRGNPDKKLLDAGLLLSMAKLAGPFLQPLAKAYFARNKTKRGSGNGGRPR